MCCRRQLSNGKRADCLIHLPNPPGPIAIDSKFPLESWLALREAADDTARTLALRRLTADVQKHVKDVAERYIIPGETAEGALIFVPSEAHLRRDCTPRWSSVVSDAIAPRRVHRLPPPRSGRCSAPCAR